MAHRRQRPPARPWLAAALGAVLACGQREPVLLAIQEEPSKTLLIGEPQVVLPPTPVAGMQTTGAVQHVQASAQASPKTRHLTTSEVVNTSDGRISRIRVIYGEDPCPGVEVRDAAWQAALDGSNVEITNTYSRWVGSQRLKVGQYRVCAAEAGRSGESAEEFLLDLGTFDVLGPRGVSPQDIQSHGATFSIRVSSDHGVGNGRLFLRDRRTGQCGKPASGAIATGSQVASQVLGKGVTRATYSGSGNPGTVEFSVGKMTVWSEFKLDFTIGVVGLPDGSVPVFQIPRGGYAGKTGDVPVLQVFVTSQYEIKVVVPRPDCSDCGINCSLGLTTAGDTRVTIELSGSTLKLSADSGSCETGGYSTKYPGHANRNFKAGPMPHFFGDVHYTGKPSQIHGFDGVLPAVRVESNQGGVNYEDIVAEDGITFRACWCPEGKPSPLAVQLGEATCLQYDGVPSVSLNSSAPAGFLACCDSACGDRCGAADCSGSPDCCVSSIPSSNRCGEHYSAPCHLDLAPTYPTSGDDTCKNDVPGYDLALKNMKYEAMTITYLTGDVKRCIHVCNLNDACWGILVEETSCSHYFLNPEGGTTLAQDKTETFKKCKGFHTPTLQAPSVQNCSSTHGGFFNQSAYYEFGATKRLFNFDCATTCSAMPMCWGYGELYNTGFSTPMNCWLYLIDPNTTLPLRSSKPMPAGVQVKRKCIDGQLDLCHGYKYTAGDPSDSSSKSSWQLFYALSWPELESGYQYLQLRSFSSTLGNKPLYPLSDTQTSKRFPVDAVSLNLPAGYEGVELVDAAPFNPKDIYRTSTVDLTKSLPIPSVRYAAAEDTSLDLGRLEGTISWKSPEDMSKIRAYSVWLSEDAYGFFRLRNLAPDGECSIQPHVHSIDVSGSLREGGKLGKYVLVYTCNEAGERYEAAAVPIFDVTTQMRCQDNSEFMLELGGVAPKGWDFELDVGRASGVQGPVVLDDDVFIEVRSSNLLEMDARAMIIVNDSMECGNTNMRFAQHISHWYKVFARGQLVGNGVMRLERVTAVEGGTLRVCFCPLAPESGSCLLQDYAVEVGTFQVSADPCYEFEGPLPEGSPSFDQDCLQHGKSRCTHICPEGSSPAGRWRCADGVFRASTDDPPRCEPTPCQPGLMDMGMYDVPPETVVCGLETDGEMSPGTKCETFCPEPYYERAGRTVVCEFGRWTVDVPEVEQAQKPPVQWMMSKGSESCEQTCSAAGSTCDLDALQATAGSPELTEAAYAAAGVTCEGMGAPCSDGSENNCADWGAPYLHKSHISGSLVNRSAVGSPCFYGASVASCKQEPADGSHHRLCACSRQPKGPPICKPTFGTCARPDTVLRDVNLEVLSEGLPPLPPSQQDNYRNVLGARLSGSCVLPRIPEAPGIVSQLTLLCDASGTWLTLDSPDSETGTPLDNSSGTAGMGCIDPGCAPVKLTNTIVDCGEDSLDGWGKIKHETTCEVTCDLGFSLRTDSYYRCSYIGIDLVKARLEDLRKGSDYAEARPDGFCLCGEESTFLSQKQIPDWEEGRTCGKELTWACGKDLSEEQVKGAAYMAEHCCVDWKSLRGREVTHGRPPPDGIKCTTTDDCPTTGACASHPVCWTHESIQGSHYCAEQVLPGEFGTPVDACADGRPPPDFINCHKGNEFEGFPAGAITGKVVSQRYCQRSRGAPRESSPGESVVGEICAMIVSGACEREKVIDFCSTPIRSICPRLAYMWGLLPKDSVAMACGRACDSMDEFIIPRLGRKEGLQTAMVLVNDGIPSTRDAQCGAIFCQPPFELARGAVLMVAGEVISNSTGEDASIIGLVALNCTGTGFLSTCVPRCQDGFVFDTAGESTELVCGKNKTFTGNPVCVRNELAIAYQCGQLPVGEPVDKLDIYPNRSTSCAPGTFHGESCALFCPPGYDQKGAFLASCAFGDWKYNDSGLTDLPICIPGTCFSAPAVLGGAHPDCINLPHGSKCPIKCDPGTTMVFESNTSTEIVCSYGQWRIPGICAPDYALDIAPVELETAEVVQTLMVFGELSSDEEEYYYDYDYSAEEAYDYDAEEEESFGFEWGEKNLPLISNFVKDYLEVDSSDIQCSVVPYDEVVKELGDEAPSRRLALAGRQLALGAPLGRSGRAVRRLANSSTNTSSNRTNRTRRNKPNPADTVFGIRVTVVVPPETEATSGATGGAGNAGDTGDTKAAPSALSISTKLNALVGLDADGNKATGAGAAPGAAAPVIPLVSGIMKKLEEEDRPVPKGLETVSVVQAVAPTVIEDYVIPKPKYVVGEWKECLNTCGFGLQKRVVYCARSQATGACGDYIPPNAKVCNSWETCSFTIWCPMGPQTQTCSQQQFVAMGTYSFFGLCFLMCFCRYCVVRCRRPKKGRHKLQAGGNRLRATWQINHANVNQKHVVWDIDRAAIDKWLGIHENAIVPADADQDNQEDGAGVDDIDVEVEDNAMLEDGEAEDEEAEGEEEDEEDEEEAFESRWCPIMREGTALEYYSNTNNAWVAATLRLSVWQPRTPNSEPRLLYNVEVGRTAKVREDVTLDCLRPKFEQAELVDVFTKRGGGSWLPASISGRPSQGATSLGYSVYVAPDDADQNPNGGFHLQTVPATRLRRRFPVGVPVEVYRGAPRSWVPAVVHPAVGEDGHPEASAPVPQLSRASPGSAGGVSPWCQIPIYEEEVEVDGGQIPRPEWVPSYLLRLRTGQVVSSMESNLVQLRL